MADENVEYADFSDMQNAPLPDIVEDAPPKENMPIQYLEETEEVKPQEEPQVQVEPKVEKENPDSYKYWQSQADKRDRELREERERREKLERDFEQIKSQITPKKEEPLPPQRPNKPTSDDPLDLIKYNQELAEYLNNTIEYNNKLNEQRFSKQDAYFQQMEAERQARIQQEQFAKQRAWQVSQLAQAGLSPDEATQALADFSKDAETPEQYFKDLAEFWKFRKGYSKPSKVEQRANRQGGLPPLGVTPSETEPQKADPSDDFFNSMKGTINRYY